MATSPALLVLAAGMAKRYGSCKPLAPLGPHGEAVIDLTVSDARAAGFGEVVLVLGPQSGAAIRYHVARRWPRSLGVAFATQSVPLGTAHALLCARPHLADRPFAVVNADDVYGVAAMECLLAHLDSDAPGHALVAYRLDATVVSGAPVTRGSVVVGPGDHLERIEERRSVHRRPDGSFDAEDGIEPATLAGDHPVSMNLWGFRPTIWKPIEEAVRRVHPGVGPDGSLTEAPPNAEEVLLPEVVGDLVRQGAGAPALSGDHSVRVLRGEGRCIGVTHATDLPLARAALAALVGLGERPGRLWESPEDARA